MSPGDVCYPSSELENNNKKMNAETLKCDPVFICMHRF